MSMEPKLEEARKKPEMDTLGIEPRASRMLSGCDTTTPCALEDFTKERAIFAGQAL